jgi:hypothetical protein
LFCLFLFCNILPNCFQGALTTQVLVAHVYNPSHSGGRDQEDHSSKPAWATSSWEPILKKTQHKKVLVECLKW